VMTAWLLCESWMWIQDYLDDQVRTNIIDTLVVHKSLTASLDDENTVADFLLPLMSNPIDAATFDQLLKAIQRSLPNLSPAQAPDLFPKTDRQKRRLARVLAHLQWDIFRQDEVISRKKLSTENPYPATAVKRGDNNVLIVPFIPGGGR